MDPSPWTVTPPPAEHLDLGDGLALRRWREDDAEAVTAAVTSSLDEIADWMPWAAGGYGEQDSRDWLAHSHQQWESGLEFDYAVVEHGDVVGSIGLMARRGPGVLEIGYWLRTDRTGHGLVTRAADALARLALSRPDVERVAVVHDAGNVRSQGVPERLGFRRVGTEPKSDGAARRTGDTSVVWELADPGLLP
ncbi:MAG TPA: GNAT family N-acetyltransferase [Motilibacteraceae bacterium]|nr:GNAT family N-acetyltransferase [Motilibacteraceae bacterium]